MHFHFMYTLMCYILSDLYRSSSNRSKLLYFFFCCCKGVYGLTRKYQNDLWNNADYIIQRCIYVTMITSNQGSKCRTRGHMLLINGAYLQWAPNEWKWCNDNYSNNRNKYYHSVWNYAPDVRFSDVFRVLLGKKFFWTFLRNTIKGDMYFYCYFLLI